MSEHSLPNGFLGEYPTTFWQPSEHIPASVTPAYLYKQNTRHGLEVMCATSDERPSDTELREALNTRQEARLTPVLLLVFYPGVRKGWVAMIGPGAGTVYHTTEISSVEQAVIEALNQSSHHEASRYLKSTLPGMATRIPGYKAGIVQITSLHQTIPEMRGQGNVSERAVPLLMESGKTLLQSLGYQVKRLDYAASLLIADGKEIAVGLFCEEGEQFDVPSVRLGDVEPGVFALAEAVAHQVGWVVVACGAMIRLCAVPDGEYVELDLERLSREEAVLLAPGSLSEYGSLDQIMNRSDQRSAIVGQSRKELDMSIHNKVIGCVGGEVITLDSNNGEVLLSVDDGEPVALTSGGASRMVDMLTDLLSVLEDTPSEGDSTDSDITEKPADIIPRRKHYTTKISDLITEGLLASGTVLTLKYHNEVHSCVVTPDGGLETEGGHISYAPSAAAKKVTPRYTCNGWDVWTAPDGRTLSELRAYLDDGITADE